MNPEKPKIEGGASILSRPEIQEFIEMRGIQPEDFEIIKKLATFPKNTIIMLFHNFFTFSREKTSDELERSINKTDNEDHKVLYGLFLELSKRYDWNTCYHLVGVLERMK